MISNGTQDKDIIFKGNDGGSTITALTLDMSDDGKAIFKGDIGVGQYIYHNGDADTYVAFSDDAISLTAGGDSVFKVSGSYAYLGPETAATVRLCHNGNTDTYFEMYANDSFEFMVGNINYLKMKEGGTDWIEINKGKVDMDFKLWGTNSSNPAIFLNAGEESLRFNAGIKKNVSEIGDGSFPYTVDARDYLITCAGSGARTINLPAVANESGRILIIKDSNGSSGDGNITLDPNGAEQIDASATYAIASNRESVTIMCDGVGWAIVSRYQP